MVLLNLKILFLLEHLQRISIAILGNLLLRPPKVGPTTVEIPPAIPNNPIYFPRCLGGTISAIIFFGTGHNYTRT